MKCPKCGFSMANARTYQPYDKSYNPGAVTRDRRCRNPDCGYRCVTIQPEEKVVRSIKTT